MNWGKVGSALKKAGLVVLGNAVPGGGLAADIITEVLGDDEDKALEAIKSDPNAVLKLREFEQAHERELVALALEQRRVELADVADARARDVKIHELKGRNVRADILAYGSLGALVGVIVLLVFYAPSESVENTLYAAIGSLTTIVTLVYNFEFGSSRGSKEKTLMNGK